MANTPVVVLDDTMTSIANAIRAKTGGSATMTPGQMPAQIAAIPSGGGAGIPREVSAQGVFQMPSQSFSFSLPANVTDLGGRVLEYALGYSSGLTAVDMSSLTAVTGSYALRNAFYNCTNLATVDLGSLTTVTGRDAFTAAFLNCSSLTSVDLGSLTTVSGLNALHQAFNGCSSLASVSIGSLASATGGSSLGMTFSGCTSLTSLTFTSLANITGSAALSQAFYGCTSLTSLSFPALTASSFGSSYTNQFNDMLSGVTGCTVHFPAAAQAKIETLIGYPNFGGTNTTVLFDL